MSNSMLTEARVHELADALTQAGESITLARIREANGHTGSLTTISRYLATWREGRRSSLETEARKDPAIDAIERLAPGTYQKVVQKAEEASRAKFEALRDQLAAQETDRANLVSALALAEERSAELTNLVAMANKNREQIISALSVVADLAMQMKALQDTVVQMSQGILQCSHKIDENRASVQAEINRQSDLLQTEFDAQISSFSYEIKAKITQVHEGVTKIQSDSIKSVDRLTDYMAKQFNEVGSKISAVEVIVSKQTKSSEYMMRKVISSLQNSKNENCKRTQIAKSSTKKRVETLRF
jgi:Plasmid replication region DNA-binding N-term